MDSRNCYDSIAKIIPNILQQRRNDFLDNLKHFCPLSRYHFGNIHDSLLVNTKADTYIHKIRQHQAISLLDPSNDIIWDLSNGIEYNREIFIRYSSYHQNHSYKPSSHFDNKFRIGQDQITLSFGWKRIGLRASSNQQRTEPVRNRRDRIVICQQGYVTILQYMDIFVDRWKKLC